MGYKFQADSREWMFLKKTGKEQNFAELVSNMVNCKENKLTISIILKSQSIAAPSQDRGPRKSEKLTTQQLITSSLTNFPC